MATARYGHGGRPHRWRAFCCVMGTVWVLAGPGCAGPPLARLQAAGGFDRWSSVESVDFTFHVRRGHGTETVRAWSWWPREDRVRFRGRGPDEILVELAYQREDAVEQEDLKAIDAWFVNDSFWLFAPLHLGWSDDVTILDRGTRLTPIGRVPMRHLTVRYDAAGGGYTPGDVYEVHVDEDWHIAEWSFHRGGRADPTLTCRWQDYQARGPLRLSMLRQSADGHLRLWFTDVRVRTAP